MDITPKAKTSKLYYGKPKNVCTAQKTISKTRRQRDKREEEQMGAEHLSPQTHQERIFTCGRSCREQLSTGRRP